MQMARLIGGSRLARVWRRAAGLICVIAVCVGALAIPHRSALASDMDIDPPMSTTFVEDESDVMEDVVGQSPPFTDVDAQEHQDEAADAGPVGLALDAAGLMEPYTAQADVFTATIDLSTTTTNGPGYIVTGNTPEYADPSLAVLDPDRMLTFTADANGRTYHIVQSGVRSDPPTPAAPKEATSIFGYISVFPGVNLTLVLSEVDLPMVSLSPLSAGMTLLLDGPSYIRDGITVPKNASLTIDGFNDDAGDRLTIPATPGTAKAHASIGSASGDAGTITINGGAIDVTARSTGAGIGNASTGSGGAVVINGGIVNVTQLSDAPAIGAGRITVTGGSVVARSDGAAAIGADEPPVFCLGAAVKVTAVSNGATPAINVQDNSCDGYFVNAQLDVPISGTEDTTLVVNPDNHVMSLTLPAEYRNFAYSHGAVWQTDRLVAMNGDVVLGDIVRTADDSPDIYPINGNAGYDRHNNATGDGALPVRLATAEPEDPVTETIDFSFYKVDELGTPMAGVGFSLGACDADQAGECVVLDEVQVFSDPGGLVVFADLSEGTYLLTETWTHPGYQLPLGQWLVVTGQGDGVAITAHCSDPAAPPPAFKPGTGALEGQLVLPNYRVFEIPLLGGAGTRWWTVMGAGLVGLAVAGAVWFGRRDLQALLSRWRESALDHAA